MALTETANDSLTMALELHSLILIEPYIEINYTLDNGVGVVDLKLFKQLYLLFVFLNS